MNAEFYFAPLHNQYFKCEKFAQAILFWLDKCKFVIENIAAPGHKFSACLVNLQSEKEKIQTRYSNLGFVTFPSCDFGKQTILGNRFTYFGPP